MRTHPILMVIAISYSSAVQAKWCYQNPEGLCIQTVQEDDSSIRARFSQDDYFRTLAIGYDLRSSRSWFHITKEFGNQAVFEVSRYSDYNNEKNESLWFTAYQAKGASCWRRTEVLYFYDNWAGTNFIQPPNDWPKSNAAEVTTLEIIERINNLGVMFDDQGHLILFCPGVIQVSHRQ
ncbi:hypothetical protein AAFX24_24010 [Vibrio mediterranei]|jgi:hypothetical protein|uniref:hypothetical protein n=1 Tax=Vibrio mediterranei TaxID=689 RepID=UPI0038CE4374